MAVPNPLGVNAFVVTDNVEKTANFWKESFGAKISEHMEAPDGTWVHVGLQFGKTYVMFGPASQAPPGTTDRQWRDWVSSPRYHGIQLYIKVANVKKVYEQARKEGAEIEQPLTDQFWGDRTFVTEDNNGLSITFAQTVKRVTPKQMRKLMEEMARRQ